MLLNLRSPVGDARIEKRIDQVENQRGQGDREDEEEDDALNEGEIASRGSPDRAVVPMPGYGEDDFHQHRAGDTSWPSTSANAVACGSSALRIA